jgi:hypothetical protein
MKYVKSFEDYSADVWSDRKRISERHTGRKHKEESKIKLSNSLKNSEKFKLACIINAERLKNFKHSEQSKINMRNARKNPLLVQICN